MDASHSEEWWVKYTATDQALFIQGEVTGNTYVIYNKYVCKLHQRLSEITAGCFAIYSSHFTVELNLYLR